ncbi:hypothetical protein [Microvirga flavescens]|uniref:hypothetical protein n=1 Tax=Microvirga flavescens TaxID=2249811 RepID=UPI0013006401|nr:hypothetical protein [Microvirga flavescens]
MDAPHDLTEVCERLNALEPGFLPSPVFHAIARLMVTVTFVVVPLLRRGGQTLVLLSRREPDGTVYPSMLNVAGTVILASDENLKATYDRLVSKELNGIPILSEPVFVGNVYDQIARGRELSLVHWVELGPNVPMDSLRNVADLPDDLVVSDRPRILMAASHFEAGYR